MNTKKKKKKERTSLNGQKLIHYIIHTEYPQSIRAFIDWVDSGRYIRDLYLLYSNSEKIKSKRVT